MKWTTRALLCVLVLSTLSCDQADRGRPEPATASARANPVATVVASPTPTDSARYASTVLVAALPWAESLTVHDDHLVIAEVFFGARPRNTSSRLLTVPISGGVPAVINGTQREGGVAVTAVAAGPGGVYVSTASNMRLSDNEVYRLAEGTRTTIAGGPGSPPTLSGTNGDGGPATAAPLQGPNSVAFGRAGEMYIAEYGDGRVRRVDRDGIITTFAGGGRCAVGRNPPTPAPAIEVGLCSPQLLATDGAGRVFIARRGSAWIEVVDENGILRVFATSVDVTALHVAPGGELYASESSRGGRLLRYDTGGNATVVATGLGFVADFALAPDGTIYVLHWPPPMDRARINRITVLSPK